MNNSLTRSVIIGFGFSLAVLLLSAAASFISIRNLLGSMELVNHTHTVINELDNVTSPLKDAETNQRGYLLTGNPRFLEAYTGTYQRATSSLDHVKSLTADNPEQQTAAEKVRKLLDMRFGVLQTVIDQKKMYNIFNAAAVDSGRVLMDSVQSTIDGMKNIEQTLLIRRTNNLSKYAGYTPVLILLASLLAILVAIFFYIKVRSDIAARIGLQEELHKKDQDITRRIGIIQHLAEKISEGNYGIRINDEEKDNLGVLAVSLNKMASSLETSFNLLSDNEWQQTGRARLNEVLVGEKTTTVLAQGAVEFIAEYTNSQVAAFYITDRDGNLCLSGLYGLKQGERQKKLFPGEGIAGACAASGKEIIVSGIDAKEFTISFAAGEAKPSHIIAFPILFENEVMGVLEIGSLFPYNKRELELLRSLQAPLATAVNTANSRARVQELLEETQAQTEELQTQHTELENLNAEMEAQTEKLQASEEELKVQQEELLEANRELEERTRLLEEKNHLIVERNLEIQQKAEELAQSTRYKSEFLANMSHELRTPLNSILLLSRLLSENRQQNLSGEQVEYAQVIQSSGNGLLELIDDILDLSKIEAGKMQIEYGRTPVSEIANDMRMLFAPLARQKNLDFNITVSPDVPADIETDKMRLEQILKNLLSNALKFTATGNISFIVTRNEKQDGWINFAVQDTGIGIPENKQQHIFEAFQQADGSTRRKYGGTGLGLSISRQLARLLHAQILLNSEPGKGSTFTLVLPASKAAIAAVPEEETEQISEAFTHDREEYKVDAQLNGNGHAAYLSDKIPADVPDDRDQIQPGDKIILIVEDDTHFAKTLLDFTRQKGYKGIVAVRGDAGIELAKQYNPTGILLDIQLPVKNGWQVMDELKQNKATRHIPVHIMSSHQVDRESRAKGAIDFVDKPVTPEKMNEIFSRIEFVLQKQSRKVLIVEEDSRHAEALSYFLNQHGVSSEIARNVADSISTLQKEDVDCVILDMGVPDGNAYEMLESIRKQGETEHVPIIIFTGKNMSRSEEQRIRQYADSIVIKTAHSYQRILDEVSLFLHLVEERQPKRSTAFEKLGALDEVLKNKVVLLADDDVRNIFSLTKALEKHKMKVLPAMDGREAINVLEENPGVDIILMDMMMPEMDGYESIRKIRSIQQYRDVPIIAVTAKAMTGDREKCIRAGASDYISKPVDIDQLVSLLRIWLYEKGF